MSLPVVHLSGSCYYIARGVGGRQTLVTLSTRNWQHLSRALVFVSRVPPGRYDEKNGTHESNHGHSHGHSHRHEEHNHEHSEL
jgi:hypothetical protein